MTLGAGGFGPPLETKHTTKKEWPPQTTNRSLYTVDLHIQEQIQENLFETWLTQIKNPYFKDLL